MSSLTTTLEQTFQQEAHELYATLTGQQLEQARRAAAQWAHFNELAIRHPDDAEQYRSDVKHAEGILINLAAQVRIDARQRMRRTLSRVLTKALGHAIVVAASA